ncbi:MAG: serine/threonine-protein kinase [Verrucomicrobiota bacterium]
MLEEEAADEFLVSCSSCGVALNVSDCGPFELVRCPECGKSVRARTKFDHFEIIGKLGEGGMSSVFEARDSKLGRHVALKILHPEVGKQRDLLQQFEREATLTAAISHPNVVKVYSVGRDHGYFYIAMELVTGTSLEEAIERNGRLAEGRVLEIGTQVVRGLRAAHEKGLIHRDIKPGNILLSTAGTAKIVDFGLALIAGRQDLDEEIWATPYYVPPEKLAGETEDFRSDIYSLGATVFHAIAGAPPFRADTASIEELRVLKARAVHLREQYPDCSSFTYSMVDKMLKHVPRERYDSYDELLRDFHEATDAVTAVEAHPEPTKRLVVQAAAIIMLLVGLMFAILSTEKENKGANSIPLGLREEGTAPTDADTALLARDYATARDLLVEGQFTKANEEFEKLAINADLSQPMLNWAKLHAGICSLVLGREPSARSLFKEVSDAGLYSDGPDDQDLAHFFLWVSRHLEKSLPVSRQELSPPRENDLTPLAWFLYGLKNWNLGRFEESAPFFSAYNESTLPKHLEWIGSYRPLAQSYLQDILLIREAPKPDSLITPDQARDMADELRMIESSLETKGAARELIRERIRRIDTSLSNWDETTPKKPPILRNAVEASTRAIQALEFSELCDALPEAQ